ncbi:hypothetical protein [Glutamicibacter ardleyensis]|uniref:hypothetical protein n=1 Tax=Glutamicibacter ardleyensis TaxID=225894 RepID=UPI003FD5C56D
MAMKNHLRKGLAALVGLSLAATTMFVGVAGANAAPLDTTNPSVSNESIALPQSGEELSPEDVKAIAEELEDKGEVTGERDTSYGEEVSYSWNGYEVGIGYEEKKQQTSPGQITPYFDIDTSRLPRYVFVYLNRSDQQALASGGAAVLATALCLIPGIGLLSCGFVHGAVQGAADKVKAKLCQGTFTITFDLNSKPKPWVSYAC